MKFMVTNEVIRIKIVSSKQRSLKIGVFGRMTAVKTNKLCEFRREPLYRREEYY